MVLYFPKTCNYSTYGEIERKTFGFRGMGIFDLEIKKEILIKKSKSLVHKDRIIHKKN